MKVICLSSIIDDSLLKKHHVRESLSRADSNYNHRLISGLEKNNINLLTLNYMPFGSYPRSNVLFFRRQSWFARRRHKAVHIGYVNLMGVKYLALTLSFIKELKRHVKHEEDVYLLIYDFYLPFLWAANYVKRKNPKIRTCLIAPSIPVFDNAGERWKERLVKHLAGVKMREAKEIDSYVFLTEHMKNVLDAADKPYVVVEGIVPEKSEGIFENVKVSGQNDWNVLYSGRLDRMYNIEHLIFAVLDIKEKQVSLTLCGCGDLDEKIKRIADREPRIRYLGFLPPESLRPVRDNASILINPRTDEGEYTKYSFPSKTMEYLASSKPVAAFKLPGIPDEYDDYIYYIQENTVSSIKRTILEVIKEIENGSAKERAEKARRFVEKQKNSKIQTKKIVEMFLRMKDEKGMD